MALSHVWNGGGTLRRVMLQRDDNHRPATADGEAQTRDRFALCGRVRQPLLLESIRQILRRAARCKVNQSLRDPIYPEPHSLGRHRPSNSASLCKNPATKIREDFASAPKSGRRQPIEAPPRPTGARGVYGLPSTHEPSSGFEAKQN